MVGTLKMKQKIEENLVDFAFKWMKKLVREGTL